MTTNNNSLSPQQRWNRKHAKWSKKYHHQYYLKNKKRIDAYNKKRQRAKMKLLHKLLTKYRNKNDDI